MKLVLEIGHGNRPLLTRAATARKYVYREYKYGDSVPLKLEPGELYVGLEKEHSKANIGSDASSLSRAEFKKINSKDKRLPFEDNHFDEVHFSNMPGSFDDWMGEARRVLRKKGTMFVGRHATTAQIRTMREMAPRFGLRVIGCETPISKSHLQAIAQEGNRLQNLGLNKKELLAVVQKNHQFAFRILRLKKI